MAPAILRSLVAAAALLSPPRELHRAYAGCGVEVVTLNADDRADRAKAADAGAARPRS